MPSTILLAGLTALDGIGIAAFAGDYRSARIGDARSLCTTGILSAVNPSAASRGVDVGMRVREAVEPLRGPAS